MYLFKYTTLYICSQMLKIMKDKFWNCSYIQNCEQNLIEILETPIYSAKHTKNTKIHFQNTQFPLKTYFPKIRKIIFGGVFYIYHHPTTTSTSKSLLGEYICPNCLLSTTNRLQNNSYTYVQLPN